MRQQKSKKDRIQSVYKKVKNSFFVSFIAPTIGLLANVFGVFGIELKDKPYLAFMYNENGLNLFFSILITILLLLSVVIIFILYVGNKYTSYSDEKEKEIYKDLLSMEIGIRKKLYDSTKNVVFKENKYKDYFKDEKSPFSERTSRTNSIHKIDEIVTRSATFLAQKFGCDENEVSICLIYQKDDNSKWEIISQNNIKESDLNIEQLMSNKESTFNNVLQIPNKYEFILDKNSAHNDGKYIKTQQEKEKGAKGSIYCKNLSIYIDSEIKKGFILSIGTTTSSFCDKDTFAKNLCLKMFESIESSIKNELINLCLMEHMGLGEI